MRRLVLLPLMLATLVACEERDDLGEEGSWIETETVGTGVSKANGGTNGDFDYCTGAVLCVAGEGDCDSNAQCTGGAVCGKDNGPRFGFPTNWDVCVESTCFDGVQNGSETTIDCGGLCGSCAAGGCPLSGQSNACSAAAGCICDTGEGDCDVAADCAAGLACVDNVGSAFMMPANFDVCLAAHCGNRRTDADETGVDCGGADCPACSGPTPTCDDGIQNQGETGIDCGGPCMATCTTVTFRLQGSQENPPNPSAASGTCTAVLAGSRLAVTLNCTHSVVGTTAAHFHAGVPGLNGAVIINLGSGTSPISGTFATTTAQGDQFFAGELYVNVHSGTFPGGEVRGQVGAGTVAFPLSGAQENPATGSAATGRCVTTLSPDQTAILGTCTHNVPATAAHIHRAAPGTNGPIVFNFGAGTSPITVDVAPTAADVADYLGGNFYVNVHSAAFPGGEIRGQITTLSEDTGSGAEENPPNGSTATLSCLSFLSPDETELEARCTHDVVGPTAAHIHRAPVGQNGPVVFNLGNAASPISTTVTFTAADAADFFSNNFYYNVHSATFPGGEVRAQILP